MHVKVSFIILLFKLKDINLQLIAYNICDVNNQYMLTPKWVSPISFIISHSVTCFCYHMLMTICIFREKCNMSFVINYDKV